MKNIISSATAIGTVAAIACAVVLGNAPNAAAEMMGAGIKRFRHRVSWIACRLWPLLGWGLFGTVLAQLTQ